MGNGVRSLVGIGIILIPVLIIAFLIYKIVHNPSPNPANQTQTSEQAESTVSKAKSSGQTVRFTSIGNIVGDEQHYSIRISVDKDNRTVDILQGYNNTVLRTQQTGNNPAAYDAFMDALNGAGFGRQVKPKILPNEAEVCPFGQYYVFEILGNGGDSLRSWYKSCGQNARTFGGSLATVQNLFKKQIPDYDKFISGIPVQ